MGVIKDESWIIFSPTPSHISNSLAFWALCVRSLVYRLINCSGLIDSNLSLLFKSNICRRHKLYKNWTAIEYFFISKIGHFLNYFLIKVLLPTPFDKKDLSNPCGPLIYCKDSSRSITFLSQLVIAQKV